jgi:hypothetical protein
MKKEKYRSLRLLSVKNIIIFFVLAVAFLFADNSANAKFFDKNNIAINKIESEKVIINEIMWMGSTKSTADEWIELWNMTNENVEIGGWEIENARSSGGSLKISSGKSIEPNGYFLISNYSNKNENSVLAVEVDEVNSSLSLLNAGNGNLILRDDDKNIIDEVLSGEWSAGENGSKKKSMERNNEPEDGLKKENWHTCEKNICSSMDYWDEQGNNFGTPGGKNSDMFKTIIKKTPSTRR